MVYPRHAAFILSSLLCAVTALSAPKAPPRPAEPVEAPITADAVERGIRHLIETHGDRYAGGRGFLGRLSALRGSEPGPQTDAALRQLQREALLANPLLGFQKLLLIRRNERQARFPQNWQGNTSIGATGYENEIAVLDWRAGTTSTLYRPANTEYVGEVDLHFGGDRMIFSMPDATKKWRIFEVRADGGGLRRVSPPEAENFDSYDPCYLPDGKIIFCATAAAHSVPCVNGGDKVGLLYVMDADGKNIRQLCFDQDHNWTPAILNNGRVLFTRWEYSDTPHYFTRILFQMNPDGTGQVEYYGSNSYWPNSIFYARAIPGEQSMVVGIVSGHHGTARAGELVLFDPSKGQREAEGAVQRIPGYGRKVEPIIRDQLVDASWPKFLHPYPLSAQHFLVAGKMAPSAPWGIYLVDVFDNIVPLKLEAGQALLEPLPLRATPTPPVIPSRVDLKRKDATVLIQNVYAGPGLAGVPAGTVKSLRLYSNHYGYPGLAGHTVIGIDGPWDVKRILGTVPVQADGSAFFRVPANTNIAIQPLDGEGKALQLMRSWYTAMPGEAASCVGCHEKQQQAPLTYGSALRGGAAELKPFYGPLRGFSFKRDVQPVIDAHCVSCHDGQRQPDGTQRMDLRDKTGNKGFTAAYVALHPYVRRPGPESDYHLLMPLEYHADTSELIQMLRKGHHGVKLDPEGWDRLITWIDLNIPDRGTWGEVRAVAPEACQLRNQTSKQFAGIETDPEEIPKLPPYGGGVRGQGSGVKGQGSVPTIGNSQLATHNSQTSWAFDATEAARRQQAAGDQVTRTIDLGDGIKMEMSLIPAGEFAMGGDPNDPETHPTSRVRIERPFWMGRLEVSNALYRLFDPSHDSAYISHFGKDQAVRGYPINGPNQPVVRIPWRKAMEFCQWLTSRTRSNVPFTLPTEAQWEWACRAGTATPFWFGDLAADYSSFGNVADQALKNFASGGKWMLKDMRFNDRQLVTAPVGSYKANPWGLHDMHGNVWEWTASPHRAYPYAVAAPQGRMVVRGGSWYDRPFRCTSAFRLSYEPWQGVYNVGFRVVCEARGKL